MDAITTMLSGGRVMTVRDLYYWALEHDALELDIEIRYRGGGGYYIGRDDPEPIIEARRNGWNTELVVTL